MSANKRGSGADAIYAEHMFGKWNAYNPNPGANRELMINRMLGRVITELAVNRFKWKNLPPTIDPRFLEMCLFYHALAVVYKDRDFDKVLAVRGSGVGYVNNLDNPVSFQIIAPGARLDPNSDFDAAQWWNKTISAYDPVRHDGLLTPEESQEKCVPIWANYIRVPDIDIVEIYASRLATIDRSIEINSKNARRNKVLKSTANTQLSVVNFSRQIDEGVEAIQVNGPLADMDAVEALDLGVLPDSYEKLHILRTRIWNECMGLLAINGANQDKKERLVAAEVGANDEQIDSMKNVALNARREAADIINRVFNTNITVDFNVDIEAEAEAKRMQTEPNTDDNEGEPDNGDVHS